MKTTKEFYGKTPEHAAQKAVDYAANRGIVGDIGIGTPMFFGYADKGQFDDIRAGEEVWKCVSYIWRHGGQK